MADKLTLEIVTPERQVLAQPVDEVILPSLEGYMGVRPGHTALFAMLDVGEISYREDGTDKYLAVSGGFAEVLSGSVSILAETAEPAEEIDVERAGRARDRAEQLIKSDPSTSELQKAEVKLKRALGRIRVHQHLG